MGRRGSARIIDYAYAHALLTVTRRPASIKYCTVTLIVCAAASIKMFSHSVDNCA